MQSVYALLFPGIKMILSVPASSVSSERVFSSSGLIHNATRNRLNPLLLEQTTILKMWLQSQNPHNLTDMRNLAIKIVDGLSNECAHEDESESNVSDNE